MYCIPVCITYIFSAHYQCLPLHKKKIQHRGRQRPIRILIVSGRYQFISNGAVSYQLKERGVCFVVTEKICMTDGVHCTLYHTRRSLK
jgi:hypothetical protein